MAQIIEPADTGISDDDAVAQLMAEMSAPSQDDNDADPEDDADNETPEPEDDDEDGEAPEDDDGNEEDPEGEPEGDDENAPTPEAPEVKDDTVLTVEIDGQAQQFTVGDLKALAGQKAALETRGAEVEATAGRTAAVLQGAIEAVLEDLKPYQGVDWMLESRRMEPDEFEWHRQTFTRLQSRFEKIVGTAQTFEQTVQQYREQDAQRRAAEAVKVLKATIPEWSKSLYEDILNYGVQQGLNEADVSNVTDPAVIQLIHKAMLFDRGKAAAAKKVNATPQKVRKAAGQEAITRDPKAPSRTLERKLASGNLSDDEAQALLAAQLVGGR